MITINYVGGPVGSGKTFSALHYIAASPNEQYLLSCPSVLLCNQSAANLRAINPKLRVTVIHSEDGHPNPNATVVSRITKHFQKANGAGEVVIITHAAYRMVKHFQSSARWHLIVDEAPNVISYNPINLAQHSNLVLDMMDIPVSVASSYSEIEPQHDGEAIKTIMGDRTGDHVCGLLRPLAELLLHPHWRCFVDAEQYERFLINRSEKGSGDYRLDTFSLMQPTIFAGWRTVTIMATEFQTTLAYLYWTKLGTVDFKPHPIIKPRSMTVPNGDLINVHYLIEGTYSKSMGRKTVDGVEDVNVSDAMEATVLEHIGNRAHVVLRNKDYQPWYQDEGVKLPHSSHGLNSFAHIDIAWVHAALNPPPCMFAFLDDIAGVSAEQVHTATAHHQMLQAVGRCSIRDYANQNERTIIVPDRATAEFVAQSLSAKTCSPLTEMTLTPTAKKSGRPRIHASEASRLESLKRQKSDSVIEEIYELNQLVKGESSGERKCLNSMGFPFSHFGTVYANIMSSDPVTEVVCSHEQFVDLLRECSRGIITRKEHRALISPSKFQSIDDVEEKRGKVNVVSANGIWLDNDGGDITPQQFASMFPHTEMYIWSTFSSTLAKPRWRVFMPTTLRTGNLSYNAITAEITRKLERRGYFHDPSKTTRKGPVFKSGFDGTKMSPQNLFYLPSTNAARPEAAFFLDFKEGARSPINPLEWIKHSRPKIDLLAVAPEPMKLVDLNNLPPQTSAAKRRLLAYLHEKGLGKRNSIIERAESEWQASGAGQGHFAFYRLAKSYCSAGLNAYEAESRLREMAYSARSREERKREIKGLIKKLF